MERAKLDAALLLAGITPLGVFEIANRYWPDVPAYAEHRRENPWWLVMTESGPVVIGWRKRVISIDWSGTTVRQKLTGQDETTSEETYCHAWGYGKAVIYLTALARAMQQKNPGAANSGVV